MASPWVGGTNYVLIRRGSNNARKGGSHSGPSGYRVGKFYADNQNPNYQKEHDKKLYAETIKSGKRHSIVKISSLIKKEDPKRFRELRGF